MLHWFCARLGFTILYGVHFLRISFLALGGKFEFDDDNNFWWDYQESEEMDLLKAAGQKEKNCIEIVKLVKLDLYHLT